MMKFIVKRIFILFTALLAVLLVAACAHRGLVEHGLSFLVYETPIYDLKITYGKVVVPFSSVSVPGSQSLWNAPMLIPEQMGVTWIAEGKNQEVIIPLEGKLSKNDKIANWRLRFYGERMELWREDDDPSSKYYRKPPVKVYP